MRVQEIVTTLRPAEVLDRARTFFMLAGTPYAATPEKYGDGFIKLHLEVGEILIATLPHPEGTLVRATASRGGQLLSRYLTLIAAAEKDGTVEQSAGASRRVA